MPSLFRFSALLLILGAAAAQAQPSVPPLTGRVVDRADVLSPSTEQTLTDQLAAHEDATSNQIAVLTVPSLEGESVERVALDVFNTWGLGQAEHDNGVLVLIARDEREMRIEVGYGLEGSLTDSRAGRIIRSEFVPAFRNGNYDAGTLAGVSAIVGTIEGTYELPDDGGDGDGIPWVMRIIFGITHVLLPSIFLFMTLFQSGCARYVLLVFFLVFIGAGGMIVLSPAYGWMLGAGVLVLYLLADVYIRRSEKWRRVREQVATASKKGKKTKVTVGGFSFHVGGSSGSSSSGGFSSGGGGFSGGGGSSGGGGASGSW